MKEFSINYQWVPRNYGDEISRATLAEIQISVANHIATRLEDLEAKGTSLSLTTSALTLAKWFASNWWRLRWEPERKTSSWLLSHNLAAAGEGYIWPNLTFASDGQEMTVKSISSPPTANGPVRYLDTFEANISALDFENGIDSFLSVVFGRLQDLGFGTHEFNELWTEILNERADPSISSFRKLEAILGMDPGEAPDDLIKDLQQNEKIFGISAIEEMAALSQGAAMRDITNLWDGPRKTAPTMKIPNYNLLNQEINREQISINHPWQNAYSAAKIARKTWSIGSGPATTSLLSEIFSLSKSFLESSGGINARINASFRKDQIDEMGIYLRSNISPNRRFSMLRLVGDALISPLEEKFLPATAMRTRRQKYQKAFAQEFLCPHTELLGFFGSKEIDDDSIEEAAEHFDVENKVIRLTLVNQGKLDRAELDRIS